MNQTTNPPVTSDEKMMAALAHFFGLLVALILWAFQKDKSRFVRFQALQAALFDFVIMLSMGVLLSCLFGFVFLGMIGSMFAIASDPSSPDALSPFFMVPFMFPFTIFACVMPVALVIFIGRIIASISVLNGQDFRYPVLGKWVEGFLSK